MTTPNDVKIKPKKETVKFKVSVDTTQPVDRFLDSAKLLVMKNYNDHLSELSEKQITPDKLDVVWFSKTLDNWKSLIVTIYADGLYYEVTHNGYKHETYVDVYRKMGKGTYTDGVLSELLENNK